MSEQPITVIISKHGPAISRWLIKQQNHDNYKHLTNIILDPRARGNTDSDTYVIGTIPYDLATQCKQYYSIMFDSPTRNPDMTAEDMLQAKAYLQPYVVFPITKNFMLEVLEHHLTKLAEYAVTNPVTADEITSIAEMILANLQA